jgi:hypothetical protein
MRVFQAAVARLPYFYGGRFDDVKRSQIFFVGPRAVELFETIFARYCDLFLGAVHGLGSSIFDGGGCVIYLDHLSRHAAKRVALVIGNSGYENVARLANPINDATAITATLKEAGFLVDTRRNMKIADMRRALRDFADTSRDADVAVVYYAGHGIEVDGTNYLIPVDATLERDLDVYDEAVPLERILVTIEPAKQLRLVMLDACRDNPFENHEAGGRDAHRRSRSGKGGADQPKHVDSVCLEGRFNSG